MRFLVGRTSEGAVSRNSPCRGAVRGPEAKAWPGEYQWFLELNTLEDLVRILHENGGGLGLWAPEEDEQCPVIEIFDEDADAEDE